jgi:hypothetical protein
VDGSKTMIIRVADGRKIPHSRVNKKEVLYFIKNRSDQIMAIAIAKSVQNYVKLSEEEILKVL